MKQVSIRELYKHLSKHLDELPFEITNHNKVIAVVLPPLEPIGDLPLVYPLPELKIKPDEEEKITALQELIRESEGRNTPILPRAEFVEPVIVDVDGYTPDQPLKTFKTKR